MAHCITRAPRDGASAPRAPRKEDGSQYEWAAFLPGFTQVAWADTVPDLVAALVGEPDYVFRSPKDQAYLRILRAIGIQVATQARINTLAQTILQQWDAACEWERQVLNGPRHVQPHGFESAPLFEGRDVWTCPIPLVLVATAYAPYSVVEPVEGPGKTVWWIDPSTDEAFLDSLAEPPVEAIRVWRVIDAPSAKN